MLYVLAESLCGFYQHYQVNDEIKSRNRSIPKRQITPYTLPYIYNSTHYISVVNTTLSLATGINSVHF
jgi:hypothetical protein